MLIERPIWVGKQQDAGPPYEEDKVQDVAHTLLLSPTKSGDFAMGVFVTGATGWVGSLVVKELIAARRRVLGLVRSDKGAQTPAGPRSSPRSSRSRD